MQDRTSQPSMSDNDLDGDLKDDGSEDGLNEETPALFEDKNMQMYCQMLLKRSLRCEHFDYSILKRLFPED